MDTAITLGHEAYRDGVVGADNALETESAVRGHTEMTLLMLNDSMYAGGMMDLIGGNQNFLNDLMAYNMGGDKFSSYVNSAYDSSSDYWKLKMYADGSHELIFDGNKELSIDYLDKEGNAISTNTPERQDMSGIGMAQSFVKVLGIDRATEILSQLGIDINDNNNFSIELITSVTGYSLEAWNKIPSDDKEKILSEKKESLVGELLMNKMGASWDENANK